MATLSYIVRGVGVAAGLVGLAACTTATESGGAGEREVGTSRSALIEAAQELRGSNNGDRSIILTFDDGPGPMAVTGELSGWLKDRGIKATFFVNGACIHETNLANNSCDWPVEDADDVLRKIVADGHLLANHTTTHRSLTGESDGYNVIPRNQWVRDITETDDAIKDLVPSGRFFFRPPYGDWSSDAYDVLRDSPMKKYIGPVYWNVGGGPTDGSRAADWECWDPNAGKNYTTKRCGDLYLKEIRNMGGGIVLMHEAKGNSSNHSFSHGVGNTVDMVKYIVPILEDEGWSFKQLTEDADIAPLLPQCAAGTFDRGDGSCKPCSTCRGGTSQACTATSDAVCIGGATNNESLAGTGTASTSAGTAAKDAGTAKADGGCNAGGAGGGPWGLAVAALALVRRRRRRQA